MEGRLGVTEIEKVAKVGSLSVGSHSYPGSIVAYFATLGHVLKGCTSRPPLCPANSTAAKAQNDT